MIRFSRLVPLALAVVPATLIAAIDTARAQDPPDAPNDFAITLPAVIPQNPLDASYTFSMRASAILRYAGCLDQGQAGYNGVFSDNLQGWGFDALAKLAYTGSCGTQSASARYDDVDARLAQLVVPPDKFVGSDIKDKYAGITVERHGDLDTGLKELIPILYLYKAKIPRSYPHVLELFARTVTGNEPKLGSPPSFHLDVGSIGYAITPETENHTLLILSEQYLANQLLNREGHPGRPILDNSKVHDLLMKDMRGILTSDFFEYNSKPYQHYALYAMENLVDFAADGDVATAARMVLDFAAGKFAVSSSLLRRSSPYRRRGSHDGSFFTGSEADEQTCRFYLYSGQLQAIFRAGTYAAHTFCMSAVREAIGTYRVPNAILGIAINKSTPYLQTFSGGTSYFAAQFGNNVGGAVEIYDNEGPFLIAAGGLPWPNGLPVRLQLFGVLWPVTLPYSTNDDDVGVSLPTVLIPYEASGNPAALRPATDRTRLVQIRGTGHLDGNLCVAPNFACGKNPFMPSGEAGNFTAGPWKFAVLPSQPIRTYVAMLTVPAKLVYHGSNGSVVADPAPFDIGLFEAEPENKFPSYDAFRQAVMNHNARGAALFVEQRDHFAASSPALPRGCSPWPIAGVCEVVTGWVGAYTRTDGTVLHFSIPVGNPIFPSYPVSSTAAQLPSASYGAWHMADGPIQADRSGLIDITSPADGSSCRLDITNIHDPRRTCSSPASNTLHSGFLIQSDFGDPGNFEMVVPQGERLGHYWRDNGAAGSPWHQAPDIVTTPHTAPSMGLVKGAAILQSNFGGNLEVVAWFHTTRVSVMGVNVQNPSSDYLVHYVRDRVSGTWSGPGLILADGKLITGVTGTPAFIQSRFGHQGNFEMLVPEGERLAHYWRDNDAAGFPWHRGADVVTAARLTAPAAALVKGAALLQSNFGGNLEAVVWLHSIRVSVMGIHGQTVAADYLVHYVMNADSKIWSAPGLIAPNGALITGITATPAFIQSTIGVQGNFEMLVPQGEKLVHYWRDNDAAGFPWHRGADVVTAPGTAAGTAATVHGVSVVQSNFGGNLDVVTWLHTTRASITGVNGQKPPEDYLAHYAWDRVAFAWIGPDVVTPDGRLVVGISGPL